MKKRRPRSKAIVVIQGATARSVSLEIGERLSIQFLESPGEEWRMIDPPDGYLLGAAKLKWEPAPGERRLKTFNFSARRAGKTKAEFVKRVEGAGGARSEIEILVT
jgi:hypothetical protein